MAGTTVSFMAASDTSEQRAVFGSYLVSLPMLGFDTAISVSNVLMAPDGIDVAGGAYEGYNKMGTLEIYLYNRDGMMTMHVTSMDSPGTGLTDGMLDRGETYTVLLSEITGDMDFVGYGWVVANFDGVAGTRTVFGPGFSQHGDMTPPASHHGAGIKMMKMDMDDMDMDMDMGMDHE
ncbi:MAG: hypothetical protein OXH11_16145 [Candidatus Aminicenantes bacterium]|nr:hypothetical protein [Candidatus Aminicenantes bacterium]